ncbi:RCC1 domain-containing protein 1 isoform X1 [Loxodonta africana]|uniref:RCC1 domain-containing protein 1 isoform X1 n=1 Tax=Loxodonta africana TaxID=9785 RepID=UPI0030CB1F19
MAEERPGAWFGFGFCGFGQALGSGPGHQVHSPEPLAVPGVGIDICRVSASWSYTAFLTRKRPHRCPHSGRQTGPPGPCLDPFPFWFAALAAYPPPSQPVLTSVAGGGCTELSGSGSGAVGGCRDLWASEALLAVLRSGPGPGAELQIWSPGAALRGEPLWVQTVVLEAAGELGPGGEAQAGALPLLPGACAYVSPRPPFYRPLAPELRARRLELGTEHALLLDASGQVFSWGSGRHGQLGHGTLEAELEPRLLEALQGLPMAEVAAGGWHSVCVSETGDLYTWGWNESGQLALPSRGLAEDGRTVTKEATRLAVDGSEVKGAAEGEDGAPAPFIAVQPFPALLDLPLGSDAVKASCGSRHTAVVTRAGELYTWGWGKYGQLGHKDTNSLDRPCRVEYFVDKQLQVKTVTCGPWNTYVYAVEQGKS